MDPAPPAAIAMIAVSERTAVGREGGREGEGGRGREGEGGGREGGRRREGEGGRGEGGREGGRGREKS